MGGYGSGRPRERPAAEQSQAWRVADVGDAVRLLLEQERHAPPGSVAEARGSIAWPVSYTHLTLPTSDLV